MHSKFSTESKKAKYESSEHKEKHEKFMSNVMKLGMKAESKSEKVICHKKGAKKLIAAKPKVSAQPPSFKDLMALAERGTKDSSVLQKIASKSQHPKQDSKNNGKELKLPNHKLTGSRNQHNQQASSSPLSNAGGQKKLPGTKSSPKDGASGEMKTNSSHRNIRSPANKTASQSNNVGTKPKASITQQKLSGTSKRAAQSASSLEPPAKKLLSGRHS